MRSDRGLLCKLPIGIQNQLLQTTLKELILHRYGTGYIGTHQDWIQIPFGQWIKIRIRHPDPDIDPVRRNLPIKKLKSEKFCVLNSWMFFRSLKITHK
jgi:hypothetical protein